ncbi:MAG: DUF502 domain-containing protein [Rubrimonas sp.]|uniref:DUF502 domain-containing protein n=1 Tax=Rubrimonas sp. TaxID=2036015 RepID=UPI002FDD98F4
MPLGGDPLHHDDDPRHLSFWARWRRNFLTGLVVIAPLYLTFWIISSFVNLIDAKAAKLIPAAWNPQAYVDIPGIGLVVFVVIAALIGALAKNLIAAQAIRWGEQMLDRLPVVRSIYNAIKQIAETVLVQSKSSFEKACLVEYPRRGLWVIAFIATRTRGEVHHRLGGADKLCLFMPTTPNPTTGFLFFAAREDVIELDMTVEEAAKLVISAGLVSPPMREGEVEALVGAQAAARAMEAAARRAEAKPAAAE